MKNPIFKKLLATNKYYLKDIKTEFKDNPFSIKPYFKSLGVPLLLTSSILLSLIENKKYQNFIKNYDSYRSSQEKKDKYYFHLSTDEAVKITIKNDTPYILNTCCVITPNQIAHIFYVPSKNNKNKQIMMPKSHKLEEGIKNNVEIINKIKTALKNPTSAQRIIECLNQFDMSGMDDLMSQLNRANEKNTLEKLIVDTNKHQKKKMKL